MPHCSFIFGTSICINHFNKGEEDAPQKRPPSLLFMYVPIQQIYNPMPLQLLKK